MLRYGLFLIFLFNIPALATGIIKRKLKNRVLKDKLSKTYLKQRVTDYGNKSNQRGVD
jgi:hypothetical protein